MALWAICRPEKVAPSAHVCTCPSSSKRSKMGKIGPTSAVPADAPLALTRVMMTSLLPDPAMATAAEDGNGLKMGNRRRRPQNNTSRPEHDVGEFFKRSRTGEDTPCTLTLCVLVPCTSAQRSRNGESRAQT